MKTAAYLYFKDQAKDAIHIYQEVFGAELVCEYTYTTEMTENQALVGKVFHAELKIGDLNLYLCDSGQEASFPSTKFVVEIPDETEARNVFAKLVRHGKLIQDFQKLPIGPTLAQGEDPFGIRWDVVIC